MKKGIHPEYNLTKITCVCGNVIETRSTVPNIQVEICSACHPFYTGKQKLVDTAGRIDRFNKRYGIKETKQFLFYKILFHCETGFFLRFDLVQFYFPKSVRLFSFKVFWN